MFFHVATKGEALSKEEIKKLFVEGMPSFIEAAQRTAHFEFFEIIISTLSS